MFIFIFPVFLFSVLFCSLFFFFCFVSAFVLDLFLFSLFYGSLFSLFNIFLVFRLLAHSSGTFFLDAPVGRMSHRLHITQGKSLRNRSAGVARFSSAEAGPTFLARKARPVSASFPRSSCAPASHAFTQSPRIELAVLFCCFQTASQRSLLPPATTTFHAVPFCTKVACLSLHRQSKDFAASC
jgi:hypothetical protein